MRISKSTLKLLCGAAITLASCKRPQSSVQAPLTAPNQPASANDEISLGSAAFQSGDYDSALEHFNKAIVAAPKDPKPLVMRAEVFQKKHDLEHAFADLTEAIRVAPPDDPNPYEQRATVRAATGNLPGVIDDLNAAIRIDPTHFKDYINRGFAYEQMGQIDKALADYMKAHEVNDKSALPHEYMGGIYLKEGKDAEALAEMNKAVETAPGLSEAYLNRGAVFLKTGKWDDAIRDYTDAIRFDPRSADAYMDRAKAFDRKGEKEKAQADRAKAKALGAAARD